MSISAQTIISLAEADVGQRETAGANRSPWLDPLQDRVSTAHGWAAPWLRGQPWCGTWAYDVLRRAGVAHADNPAHPSTETMWVRAQAAGTLTTRPVPGCLIIWRGIHTGIVIAVDTAAGVVHTVEGNSGDAVTRRVRRSPAPTVSSCRTVSRRQHRCRHCTGWRIWARCSACGAVAASGRAPNVSSRACRRPPSPRPIMRTGPANGASAAG